MTWVFLVLLYGILKGGREIAKKKAMYTNTVMEVLVAYTAISFILVVPQAKDAAMRYLDLEKASLTAVGQTKSEAFYKAILLGETTV